jgi:hypothetical protein
MKFIASKIHWIGLILLIGFTAAAAGLYFDTPSAPKKKAAPVATTKVGDMTSHAGCNHHGANAGAEHGGCSMATDGSESDGCCGGKSKSLNLVLPAGHPPVEGYTVATESDPHAHCNHGAGPENADSNTAIHP